MLDDAQIRAVIEEAYKNPRTRAQYLHRLEHLGKVCGGVALYTILAEPERYGPRISSEYPNMATRKNMLTLVLALFKQSDVLSIELAEAFVSWRKQHDALSGFINAQYHRNEPSEQQAAKYTTWTELTEKVRELRTDRRKDVHETRAGSMEFVLLSLLSSVPPKRADYGRMRVYYGTDPNLPDENYIVLRERESYMVFRMYKTSYGGRRVDEVLPTQTARDIKDSLRRHPREYLFETRFGEPFANNQGFSQYVIRVFNKFFERRTGVTMLRHIYITENVSWDRLSDEELAAISMQMMHSSQIQRKYHWKHDAVCAAMARICKGPPGSSREKPSRASSEEPSRASSAQPSRASREEPSRARRASSASPARRGSAKVGEGRRIRAPKREGVKAAAKSTAKGLKP